LCSSWEESTRVTFERGRQVSPFRSYQGMPGARDGAEHFARPTQTRTYGQTASHDRPESGHGTVESTVSTRRTREDDLDAQSPLQRILRHRKDKQQFLAALQLEMSQEARDRLWQQWMERDAQHRVKLSDAKALSGSNAGRMVRRHGSRSAPITAATMRHDARQTAPHSQGGEWRAVPSF
jgi:hypothetical protein